MRRTKRSRRSREFVCPDGDIWDSKFEWQVFVGLRDLGYDVRRCDERDTISYSVPIKEGRCLECLGYSTVQRRLYTADLFVAEPNAETKDHTGREGYFVECKGYIRKADRYILLGVSGRKKGSGVRIMWYNNAKATPKKTNVEYANSILKMPAAYWNNGAFEWSFPK